MRKIVIVGGSAAGMMAAISAAAQDSNAQITVISGDAIAYRRPGIPALIAADITEPSQIAVFSKQTLGARKIEAICPAEATDIDVKNRTLTIDLQGPKKLLDFDSAVIATGGRPIIPDIPGADKKGVCTFTTFQETAEITKMAGRSGNAVVVGAGFIALEIAESLMHKGLKVYFNVRSRILRKLVEPDVSEFLNREFERSGLRMLAGESISEIGGDRLVEYVVFEGEKIPTKLVIMGTGVRPNVSLARRGGIELGPSGAIKVSNKMQTSAPGIFAAGDCAESPDLGTGKFVYSPVGSIGAMAGKIAGVNAAGGNKQTAGFLRAQADEILGLQIYSIGHSSTTAKEVNLQVAVENLQNPGPPKGKSTSDYLRIAKLLTNKPGKIVGGQLVTTRYGSQYAWQLYQAVLNGQKKDKFLLQFNSPCARFVETMSQAVRSTVSVRSAGTDGALEWQNKLSEEIGQ